MDRKEKETCKAEKLIIALAPVSTLPALPCQKQTYFATSSVQLDSLPCTSHPSNSAPMREQRTCIIKHIENHLRPLWKEYANCTDLHPSIRPNNPRGEENHLIRNSR